MTTTPLPTSADYVGHLATLLRRVADTADTACRLDTVKATVAVLRRDPELARRLLDEQ